MHLNLDDTTFIFDVRNYDNEYNKKHSDDSWCKVNIIVKNRYFYYKKIMSELLLSNEIDIIKKKLEKLLSDEIDEVQTLSFIESDLSMILYPKFDIRNDTRLLFAKEGCKIRDLSLKLEINLTDNRGSYTDQKYTLVFSREQIQKLYDYLNSDDIQKYVDEEDEDDYEWESEYDEEDDNEKYDRFYSKNIEKLKVSINSGEELFCDVIIGRGKDYYYRGKVTSIEKLNGTYFAKVLGSDNYTVSIKLDENQNIIELDCTCPCDFCCKHEYATILEIRDSMVFEGLNCPKCKSKNVAKILWGMPMFTKALEKDIKDKKIVLGGCVVIGNELEFHCNDCSYEFNIK